MLYDRDLTETSKGALLELCMTLDQYRGDFILVGGWAPYFLTRRYFDHCGSIDIDLVLRPSIVSRYQSIKEVVESLGFVVTRNPFRFSKDLITLNGVKAFTIHLDFLTEPEPALRQGFIVEVQEDLRACLIPGISIVFKHFYEEELEARLTSGGEIVGSVMVADIVGALTTKGNALPRLKDKDSYDIYAVAGHCDGSPIKASERFKSLIQLKETGDDPVVLRALQNIRNGFSSPTRYGCFSVSRFIGSNGFIRNDAFQKVSTFLGGLSLV